MENSNKQELPKIEDHFIHNDDFSVVILRRKEAMEFQLDPAQADVVKKLFENFEKGIQWVSSRSLIKNYSKQKNIQRIFKSLKDWKLLIRVNEKHKGQYGLNLPLHPLYYKDGTIVFEEKSKGYEGWPTS